MLVKRSTVFVTLVWLLSCVSEDNQLVGRWQSRTPKGFQFVEFSRDGSIGVGDHPDRMTVGRYRFRSKGTVIIEIPTLSSFPGEFQVWQVAVSENDLSTYREGSFGLAGASREFRRIGAR